MTRKTQLICTSDAECVWAALAFLTRYEGYVSIDVLGDFLKDCQKRAERAKGAANCADRRYARIHDAWDDNSIIKAITSALHYNLADHMRVGERNYLTAIPPDKHGLWTVASTDLTFDPSWNYQYILSQKPSPMNDEETP